MVIISLLLYRLIPPKDVNFAYILNYINGMFSMCAFLVWLLLLKFLFVKFSCFTICKLLYLFSLLVVIHGINRPQFIYSTVDGYFSLQFEAFMS